MPLTSFSDADVREVAMALCREHCAYYGEPPCFAIRDDRTGKHLPWPPESCDEPGCMALAHAAVSALVV